jgi:hypothetical protein
MKENFKDSGKIQFMKKRDLYTSFAMCGIYAIAGLMGGQWGYMFCSLTIFHIGVLYMSMHREKMFGLDIMPLLLPVAGVGWFFYSMGAKAYMSIGLQNIIHDQIFAWFFMGIAPLFVQRTVQHVQTGRK